MSDEKDIIRILAIENPDPLYTALLSLLNEETGYEVVLWSPQEVLPSIDRGTFDMCLALLQLPDLEALPSVLALHEQEEKMPLLLFSSEQSLHMLKSLLGDEKPVLFDKLPKKKKTLKGLLYKALKKRYTEATMEEVIPYIKQQEMVFVVPSNSNMINGVVMQILTLLKEEEVQEQHAFNFRIAISEALRNAMVHGNKEDPNKKVYVRAYKGPRIIRITIRDEGAGFDPTVLPNPTDELYVERVHGRGVYLMNQFIDEVVFSQKGSEVTLTSFLQGAQKKEHPVTVGV